MENSINDSNSTDEKNSQLHDSNHHECDHSDDILDILFSGLYLNAANSINHSNSTTDEPKIFHFPTDKPESF